MPGESQVVRRPDVVIVEGINVLQVAAVLSVSDFFDFSIYVDADEDDILQWYVERFKALRGTVFNDERSFFHHFAALDDAEAVDIATVIWRDINGRNLADNIFPTRERADLILRKGADHRVAEVRLRKI